MPKVSLMRPIPYEPPPGMNLLDVKWPADHIRVVSVIGHAAFVLEREGRIAIESFVLSAGGVMREAAAALRDVHSILRELGSRASAKARHRRMQVLTPACAKAASQAASMSSSLSTVMPLNPSRRAQPA